MNINNLLKNKWRWIIGGIILFLILILFKIGNKKEIELIQVPQSQIMHREISEEELILKQKEIKEYLFEIEKLKASLDDAEILIGKAVQQLQKKEVGLAFVTCIDVRLIYESIIEKLQGMKIPTEGSIVQSYFLESVQFLLDGVKMGCSGLEKVPIDEDIIWQGVELRDKAIFPMSKEIEEINKLKERFDLK